MSELPLLIVKGLLDMRDAPDPTQGFSALAEHIGRDAQVVYGWLLALEVEKIVQVCERRYSGGSLSSASGWDVVSVERAEQFLRSGGRLFRVKAPGPRSRPSGLAERAVCFA